MIAKLLINWRIIKLEPGLSLDDCPGSYVQSIFQD